MAEVSQYIFSHRELAEALIRKQDLHEGIWAVVFQFALAGANVPAAPGGDIVPSVIIPILHVGLQKTDTESPIAVDATKVNPKKN